jgi:hypothetical protein
MKIHVRLVARRRRRRQNRSSCRSRGDQLPHHFEIRVVSINRNLMTHEQLPQSHGQMEEEHDLHRC